MNKIRRHTSIPCLHLNNGEKSDEKVDFTRIDSSNDIFDDVLQ